MDQSAQEITLESMDQASWYNNWTVKKFRKYLKGEILEVGCGIGNFTEELTKYGDVTALDIEKNFIRITKEKLGEKASVGFGDIEQGRYFFKQKKFDTVVCLNVLEHIKDDQRALINIKRLLKPKGYLILIIPSGQRLYGEIDRSIGHYRRYSKKEVSKKLKKAELKTIKIRVVNFIGGIGWFISGKIFKNNVVGGGKMKIFNLISPLLLIENLWEPPMGTSVFVIARK